MYLKSVFNTFKVLTQAFKHFYSNTLQDRFWTTVRRRRWRRRAGDGHNDVVRVRHTTDGRDGISGVGYRTGKTKEGRRCNYRQCARTAGARIYDIILLYYMWSTVENEIGMAHDTHIHTYEGTVHSHKRIYDIILLYRVHVV